MRHDSDYEQEIKTQGEISVTPNKFFAALSNYARNELGDGYLSPIMDQNPTPEIVKIFLENNANPNPPGEIPLVHKAKTPEMVQLLVSYKANINAQINACKTTALYPCCALITSYTDKEQYNLAKKLIACKANPNHKDRRGTAPLQYCVSTYCVGFVQALLEAKANVRGVEQAIFIDPTSLSCSPDTIPDKIITIIKMLAKTKADLSKLRAEVLQQRDHGQFHGFYEKLLTVLDK